MVKSPVGTAGLLIVPQNIPAYYCDAINRQNNGATCDGIGKFPDYRPGLSPSDVKSPACGSATIEPNRFFALECMQQYNEYTDFELTPIPGCYKTWNGSQYGLQTDFYLYITMENSTCSWVNSYPLPCAWDIHTNRPLVGTINLCPSTLASETKSQLVTRVTHELTHILGLLWGYFYSPGNNNSPYFITSAGHPSPSQASSGQTPSTIT